jgi:enoyl-CoA hydratase/carnithine racemase
MFHARDEGPVRWLTMSNPARRNAIPLAEWPRLAEAFESFGESGARVLVVTGEGDDFCSGADLAGGMASTPYDTMGAVGAAATALHRLAKPTIAAVDGYAVGAGMNLAIGCDIVVATDRARFSEMFVKRGLTLDFGGTWLLPRLVGLARAKELALSGRVFGAAEAFDYGMVARVVPPDLLVSEVSELAAQLASGAPLAQRFIKAGLDRSHEMPFDDAIAYERTAQSVLFSTEDVAEGVAAFAEKREPRFQGK